jgi:hypothetical protein
MKIKMIEIFWNGEEGELTFTQEFVSSYKIVKLDLLADAQAALQEIYKSMLKEG